MLGGIFNAINPFCTEYPTSSQRIVDVSIIRSTDQKKVAQGGIGKMVGGELSEILGRPLIVVCINRDWNSLSIWDPILKGDLVGISGFMSESPVGVGAARVSIGNMFAPNTYTNEDGIIWFFEVAHPDRPSYGPIYTPI